MLTQYDIDKFYEDVALLKLKRPNATIVKATGEPKGSVSAYLNKVRDPTEPFLKRFYEKFAESLKNVPRETAEITGKSAPEADYHKKYTALLEEVKQLQAKIINEKDSKSDVQGVNEISLIDLSAAQISMQNKLDVLFEAFAFVASGGDATKAAALMKEWGKRIASKGREKHHKGNETDGHKISM